MNKNYKKYLLKNYNIYIEDDYDIDSEFETFLSTCNKKYVFTKLKDNYNGNLDDYFSQCYNLKCLLKCIKYDIISEKVNIIQDLDDDGLDLYKAANNINEYKELIEFYRKYKELSKIEVQYLEFLESIINDNYSIEKVNLYNWSSDDKIKILNTITKLDYKYAHIANKIFLSLDKDNIMDSNYINDMLEIYIESTEN